MCPGWKGREGGCFLERPKYPAPSRLFLAGLVVAICAAPAQGQTPEGRYVMAGPSFLPGYGAVIGGVEAGRFLTREVAFAAGYRPSEDGSIRTSATIGGAIRLLAGRRTVLDAPIRRRDLDIGFRLGPAVLFRFEESAIERNRRFTLLADPFVRFIWRRKALFVLEAGLHRPAIRTGVLIPIGRP